MPKPYKPQQNVFKRTSPSIPSKLKAYNIAYYKKNRARILENAKEYRRLNQARLNKYSKEYRKEFSGLVYTQKYRKLLREYIVSVKDNAKCLDCGYRYPHFMLDFDHTGSKSFNISAAAAKKVSIKTLVDEIAKCELVCSNCHRIRTYIRQNRHEPLTKKKTKPRKVRSV